MLTLPAEVETENTELIALIDSLVAEHLEGELGVSFGETTPDGEFTLEWANCIGLCDRPPAMLVDTDARVELTPERVDEILAGLRG